MRRSQFVVRDGIEGVFEDATHGRVLTGRDIDSRQMEATDST